MSLKKIKLFASLKENLSKCFRYVIFYTPFDIGYKIAKFLPVKIVCAAMKEIYRQVNINFKMSFYPIIYL